MKSFYFTNPTADRHKAREIQLQIEKQTGLSLINPFYGADGSPTEEIRQLDNGEPTTVRSPEIVAVDMKMIRDSDGIVGWISDRTSWGSIQEAFYCHQVLAKPVYLIFDPDTRSRINNPQHPWAIESSTRIFGNVEGFIAYAKEKLSEPKAA
jgi:hypothetical protein